MTNAALLLHQFCVFFLSLKCKVIMASLMSHSIYPINMVLAVINFYRMVHDPNSKQKYLTWI